MKELQKQLFGKLEGTGWDKKLRFFSDFDEILKTLEYEAQEGRRFTPPLKFIFKPFELTSLDKVKVVFLVPEPFLDPNLNTGLALSCKETDQFPTGIFKLRQELEKKYPKSQILTNKKAFELISWADQGVLLLNCSLTARIQSEGRHKSIWSSFTYYVLDILNRMPDLAFVFFGETGYEDSIDGKHFKIYLKDLPKDRDHKWETEGIFEKVNEYLKLKNISLISW